MNSYLGYDFSYENNLTNSLEVPEFIRQTESFMDEVSKKSFIDYIAAHPLEGDVIVGAGGIRKTR